MTKICSKCKIEKDEEQFIKRKFKFGYGLHSWCNACRRTICRNAQARNRARKPREQRREEWKDRSRKYRAEHPDRTIEVARRKVRGCDEDTKGEFVAMYVAWKNAERAIKNKSVREQPANQQSQHS